MESTKENKDELKFLTGKPCFLGERVFLMEKDKKLIAS
jgi:hypothetical protein